MINKSTLFRKNSTLGSKQQPDIDILLMLYDFSSTSQSIDEVNIINIIFDLQSKNIELV